VRCAELRAELAERGGPLGSLTGKGVAREIELLAGDPAAAAAVGEEHCRVLEDKGWAGSLSSAAGTQAQAYYALGRLGDAEAWSGRAAELGASDDADAQMLWRVGFVNSIRLQIQQIYAGTEFVHPTGSPPLEQARRGQSGSYGRPRRAWGSQTQSPWKSAKSTHPTEFTNPTRV
jgi:hypothetical protein